MVSSVHPFLMFQGKAEEAMALYLALFPDSELIETSHFGPEGRGAFQRAKLRLAGQEVMIFESPVKHAFDFTPSFSFFVECDSEAELTRLHEALSESGQILMPLDAYDFSRKFAWVVDRYGVSWQLNLA